MLSYALMVPSLTLSAEAAQAVAAEDEDEDDAEPEALDEVNITGTRIQTPGNFNSANPINTITGEEMRQLGIVNVGDALLQLVPQNISTYQPTMVGDDQAGTGGAGMETMDRSSFFIGNTIANLRGMDPAFGSRTLTLVDGRRMVSTSNQADVVDLNIIPSNMLQRMDVVTGGASATYGSGAMAGVVNLVLNNKLTGFQFDADYGINEAGDGGNPHISASGGMPLFGGRAHALLGVEWQRQSAIRDCAAARAWCAESRTLFTNATGSTTNQSGVRNPIDGFEDYPTRFETRNVRYSQWGGDTPEEYGNGSVYHNSTANTTGFRLTQDGTGIVQYPYGLRGGLQSNPNAAPTAINGDGPVTTSGTAMRPSNNRKTLFGNFEFNITERTTAYLQTNYAKTEAVNHNRFTLGTHCVRFNTPGTAGTNVGVGVVYWTTTAVTGTVDGARYPADSMLRSPALGAATGFISNTGFRDFLGLPGSPTFTSAVATASNASYLTGNGVGPGGAPFTAGAGVFINTAAGTPTNGRGVTWPYWIPVDISPSPPSFNFNGNGVGKWVRYKYLEDSTTAWGIVGPGGTHTDAAGRSVTPGSLYTPFYRNDFWLLESVTLTAPYEGGNDQILPGLGRNSYAFLNTLDPEALNRLQNSTVGAVNTVTSGGGVDLLYGAQPCGNYTPIRKTWNPQVAQVTSSTTEVMRVVGGVKGRFGRDWRWDGSYTYGKTESQSSQTDVPTNIRMAFAMDAVIDDRGPMILDTRSTVNGVPNPTFNQMIPNPTNGQPICRVVRDGTPVLDSSGRPLSDAAGLAAMGADCRPLNVFGQTYAQTSTVFPGYNPAETQREALDYAFVNNSQSGGENSLQTLSFSVNGTLWQGWGAGPLTSAFGVEARRDKANQDATSGSLWERYDLSRVWADAFGGSTTVTEGFTELNMPLVSGQPGVNLWSLNFGGRYSSYRNKGGAGTAVDADGNHLSATQNVFNWKFQTVFEPFDWIRLRLSRSRDLRTAGYRELFINQPGVQDSSLVRNPWRERTALTNENQNERYTLVQVGNPNLKPEKSNTLTLGLVLSPGGWAQGMRFSADYYNIHVTDGIGVSNSAASPINECFAASGGVNPIFDPGSGELTNQAEYDAWRNGPNVFNANDFACQQLVFAANDDGSRNLQDLVASSSARPSNLLPYQTRGLDLSLSYLFPLSRAFEELPGNISLTIRAQRAMEASGLQISSSTSGFYDNLQGNPNATEAGVIRTFNPNECGRRYDAADPENNRPAQITQLGRIIPFNNGFYTNRYTCVDLVGQIRSGTFIPGVSATPKWTGNVVLTYLVGDLTASLSARYIGGAKFDNTWGDSPDDANYQNAQGQFLNGSIDNNHVKAYVNYALNGSYNLQVGDMKQFQVFGSINNLFDKSPPFTGGGLSGASATFHDTMGRAYRMGVRLKF
jgi:outer membrane receptor protein involved in Fe transport